MRFRADEHVIDLLIGNLLYTTPDAAARELLQNAEDACDLQRIKEPAYLANIVVRYSASGNWIEVVDNGLGMNEEAIDQSFAAVGAHKDRVSHIQALLQQAGATNRQIARFGIGIVSCFGVAQSIIVRTKMDDSAAIAYRIDGIHDDFTPLPDLPTSRGTTVRLTLKPNGPMRAEQMPTAVHRYARHAEHVFLEDADNGTRSTLAETWQGKDLADAVDVVDQGLRSGLLAPDPQWQQPGTTLRAQLVLCNGGFLVSERELTLLPSGAIGYVGEMDVHPGELTIQLNREAFAHDERWNQLQGRLKAHYNKLIVGLISEWERVLADAQKATVASAIDRGVLLLARGPTRGLLEPKLVERIDQLVPQAVRIRLWDSQQELAIATILDNAGANGVLYYLREGEAAAPFQQQLQQGLMNIQVTETPQTETLRAAHLRAKSFLVLLCKRRDYPYEMGGGTQTLTVFEHEILSTYCQQRGIRFTAVRQASLEEVALTPVKESKLFADVLGLAEQFALVDLPQASDRVIRDFNVSGRFLNCAHPEVREILAALPDVVGNPVKRALLQAYLDIDNWRLGPARSTIKGLLMDPNLPQAAQLSTGPLTKEYLAKCLAELLKTRDPS